MSKPAKKTITVKSKAVAKAPASKPKLAKRTKSTINEQPESTSDVEIEFEEEPNVR